MDSGNPPLAVRRLAVYDRAYNAARRIANHIGLDAHLPSPAEAAEAVDDEYFWHAIADVLDCSEVWWLNHQDRGTRERR